MKTPNFFSGRQVLGALVIVLLGSYAAQSEELQVPASATDTNLSAETARKSSVESALPTAETDSDSAYAELVRLVRAGVDQSVILSYVENSLRFFELDATRIIYLSDLEIPPDIIAAAMERDQQLLQEGIAAAPSESAAATEAMTNPPEVTEDYLYDTLAPYGSWIYIEGYGRCWQPAAVTYHADWRPYRDNGRWIYTDCGWYWMSDYSWGWAAFHYGRWFRHDRYGWCWWPDTVWAPSWVSWRYDRTYCGWAPLPPYTSCRTGAGIVYRGNRVSVGFNFGLDADCYTFIATKNFCDPKPDQHYVDRREAKRIYDRTRVFNRMDYDVRKKRVVNEGISPNIISTLSNQAITPVSVRHAGSRPGNNSRHEQVDRNTQTLVVSRPQHAVPQNKPSAARTHSSAQRTAPVQPRSDYMATAGRNSPPPGRPPEARVQNAKPSGTRQPTPAPQARQQRSTPSSGGATSSQPAAQRPAPPQGGNQGYSVTKGKPANGNANGQGQANRPSNPGRPHAVNGGQ